MYTCIKGVIVETSNAGETFLACWQPREDPSRPQRTENKTTDEGTDDKRSQLLWELKIAEWP